MVSTKKLVDTMLLQTDYRINGKRPARTPCYLEMRKGSSSSMRLLGQAGSFSRVSFSQA